MPEAAPDTQPEPPVAGAAAVARSLGEGAPAFTGLARLFFALAAGQRAKLGLAIALMLAGIAGHLVFVSAAGTMVDTTLFGLGFDVTLGGQRTPRGIDEVGLFLGATMLVVLVCAYFDMSWFIEIGERASARLRSDLFAHLARLPMAFHDRSRVGELGGRLLADVAVLQETWTNDLRNLLKYSLLLVGAVAMLFAMSAKLAAVVLLSGPVILLVTLGLGKRIRAGAAEAQERLSATSVIVEETLTAARAVKTFANEAHETARFREALGAFLRPAIVVGRYRSAFVCGVLLTLFAAMIGLMWYGSREIAARRLTPGDFMSFMFALGLATSSGVTMAELIGRFHRVSGATRRLLELLREPVEDGGGGEIRPAGRLEGRVEFRGVTFTYPSRPETRVLDGIDLVLAPGERVALIGPSGAGKSTLGALLFRLYDPDAGAVLLDGRDSRDYPLGWLRARMADVPQEVLLFGGSVAENIAYGKPGATRGEIEAAARRAHAHDFVSELPDGYETRVGERGVQLSGGQRQRIAIARAILRDPAILLLDEATSSLDSESERHVAAAMDDLMRSRTTLIIAHRLSTIRDADRIVVLRDGRIAEEGRHEALHRAGGFYRSLCDAEKALDAKSPELAEVNP